jgi:hypothetical protein
MSFNVPVVVFVFYARDWPTSIMVKTGIYGLGRKEIDDVGELNSVPRSILIDIYAVIILVVNVSK